MTAKSTYLSGLKTEAKNRSWERWAKNMAMLRVIHQEIDPRIKAESRAKFWLYREQN